MIMFSIYGDFINAKRAKGKRCKFIAWSLK